MADFRGYVTAAGQIFEALAKQMGYPVTIGFIEVGDGKLPDSESPIDRTQLVHKLKQFPAIVEQDAKNPGQWVATCYIPADDAIDGAGYFIREIGCKLINQGNGVLYAYRRVSDDWKPVITSGEAKSFIYKLRFIPSNGELLTPTIDPSVVLVDKEELARVMKAHAESRNHPDASETEKGFSRHASQAEVDENKPTTQEDQPVVTVEKLWGWSNNSGGKIKHALSLWRRSLTESGYDLLGVFGEINTIESETQCLLSEDGTSAYYWSGELPKEINENDKPEDLGWVDVSKSSLRLELSSRGGAGLIGGLPVFVTSKKYHGGASVSLQNNIHAISAAIDDAIALNTYVYWPDVYEVQDSIPNFNKVRHTGPGGIKRAGEIFRVHPLEWHSNTFYCSPSGSDSNDGLTASYPIGTMQHCMDLIKVWSDADSIQHGSWKFKILPGVFSDGGYFAGFVPVQDFVVFEGSHGADGLPNVLIDGSSSAKTAGLYFDNGPSMIKVSGIASDNFRSNSVSSGIVFYGKGISTAWVYDSSAKNNIWSGLNADSIGRLLLTGGTYDANTQYNLRVRGGVAISIGIYGGEKRTTLKNNATAVQIRDCCSGHMDYVDIVNHPSTPLGTALWVANCSRVTLNSCSINNVNLGISASENSTISISDDTAFNNVNTKYRLSNNSSIDQTELYDKGDGLAFDYFRDEYSIGLYGYKGVLPLSTSSAYAFYTNKLGVVDYSFLTKSPARQRMIFGSGATAASRDKFVVDFNSPSGREDHYMDGNLTLRVKSSALTSGQDNASSIGEGGVRFTTGYFATNPIVSSDGNLKTRPLKIDDVVLDAWGEVQFVIYQWLDSIQQKGEELARWHFGVIAQQVRDSFISKGLDGTVFGLLCYDKWDDEFEPETEEVSEDICHVDSEGNEVIEKSIRIVETGNLKKVREAGELWGIRPDQCLFIEAAYQRRCYVRLSERVKALEKAIS